MPKKNLSIVPMNTTTKSLQRLALRLTSWLPQRKRAIWLTTFYELHRFVILGHTEPWLAEHVRGKYQNSLLVKLIPIDWLLRLYGAAYCLRLHRQNHVLPGVRKILGGAQHEGSDAGLPEEAFPLWMQEDLLVLSKLEAQLCPNKDLYRKFHAWRPHAETTMGDLFAKAKTLLEDVPYDVVLIAPWLRTGGADKGLIQYCEYYLERNLRVALLTTYPGASTRLHALPPGVKLLELGESWKVLDMAQQAELLARLLLQLRPKLVHNALSEVAWRCYEWFGKPLRAAGISLAASLYAEDLTPEGCRLGYVVDFLPKCRNQLDILIADSWAGARYFQRHYALNQTLVHCVHFYVNAIQGDPHRTRQSEQSSSNISRPTVLWAGRICPQKRPDLLFKIASRMPEVLFEVFGPIEPESTRWASMLKKLENVTLMGEYANFHALAKQKRYDLFLYTTLFDGMPNVLLEAASEGLPIVAPAHVGGLSELLDESTAFCVSDENDAESYVKAMRDVLTNPELAYQRSTHAINRIHQRFSRQAFFEDMQFVMSHVFQSRPRADEQI